MKINFVVGFICSSYGVVHATSEYHLQNINGKVDRILEEDPSDVVMLGSCSYENVWSGSTCMEFRSLSSTSSNLESMKTRCDMEPDSTLTMDKGCFPTTVPSDLAGWCVKDLDAITEATSMMITDMADCSMNQMACEQFVSGDFEAVSSDCKEELAVSNNNEEHDMSNHKEKDDSVVTTDILIESFDDPKFLWEFYATSDMMDSYNEYNDKLEANDYWNETDNRYFQSGKGSFEIVDGVMIVTANISTLSNMIGEASWKRNGLVSVSARSGDFPDLSSCKGLKLIAKTSEEYDGYKLDFGYKKLPEKRFAFGYRSNITIPKNDDFIEVVLPFSDFTLDYDFDSGKQLTSCDEDESYCPDESTLKNMETLTIMAGWIDGYTQLHIQSIHGTECSSSVDDTVEPGNENNEYVGMSTQLTCSSDSVGDEIIIESFSSPSLSWMTMNDPVMGGESYSDMKMGDDTAIFSGEVKDVPFLGVPGFIQMEARGGTYPDVSCCEYLKLDVMGMEEYEGYRVSFGTRRAKSGVFATGFKADFDAPTGEFGHVIIPFNMFSVEWDEATGDQIITCEEDPTVCPDEETLRNMQTIALWGEGVGGMVNLHVKSISAVGCDSSTASSISSNAADNGLSSSAADNVLHGKLQFLFALTTISSLVYQLL